MEVEEVENVDIRWLWRSFKLKRDEDQTSAVALKVFFYCI